MNFHGSDSRFERSALLFGHGCRIEAMKSGWLAELLSVIQKITEAFWLSGGIARFFFR
jgi:hypothetical protein